MGVFPEQAHTQRLVPSATVLPVSKPPAEPVVDLALDLLGCGSEQVRDVHRPPRRGDEVLALVARAALGNEVRRRIQGWPFERRIDMVNLEPDLLPRIYRIRLTCPGSAYLAGVSVTLENVRADSLAQSLARAALRGRGDEQVLARAPKPHGVHPIIAKMAASPMSDPVTYRPSYG